MVHVRFTGSSAGRDNSSVLTIGDVIEGSAISTKFSLKKINEIITKLNDNQKEAVRRCGFGTMLDLKCSQLPRDLAVCLAKWFDCDTRTVNIPNVGSFEINAYTVHQILGIPLGGRPIENIVSTEARRVIAEDFGTYKTGPSIANLMVLVKDDLTGDKFVRVFMLLFLSTFLCPTSHLCASPDYFNALITVDNIRSYDWCAFGLDWLVDKIRKFQICLSKPVLEGKKQSVSLGGCLFILVATFFDYVDLKTKRIRNCIPRLPAWDDRAIRSFDKLNFAHIKLKDISLTPFVQRPSSTTRCHSLPVGVTQHIDNLIGIDDDFREKMKDMCLEFYKSSLDACFEALQPVFAKQMCNMVQACWGQVSNRSSTSATTPLHDSGHEQGDANNSNDSASLNSASHLSTTGTANITDPENSSSSYLYATSESAGRDADSCCEGFQNSNNNNDVSEHQASPHFLHHSGRLVVGGSNADNANDGANRTNDVTGEQVDKDFLHQPSEPEVRGYNLHIADHGVNGGNDVTAEQVNDKQQGVDVCNTASREHDTSNATDKLDLGRESVIKSVDTGEHHVQKGSSEHLQIVVYVGGISGGTKDLPEEDPSDTNAKLSSDSNKNDDQHSFHDVFTTECSRVPKRSIDCITIDSGSESDMHSPSKMLKTRNASHRGEGKSCRDHANMKEGIGKPKFGLTTNKKSTRLIKVPRPLASPSFCLDIPSKRDISSKLDKAIFQSISRKKYRDNSSSPSSHIVVIGRYFVDEKRFVEQMKPRHMIGSDVMDVYCEAINCDERMTKERWSKYCVTSDAIAKLKFKKCNIESVKRLLSVCTIGIDIEHVEMVMMPVCHDNHWWLIVANMRDNCFQVLNSLNMTSLNKNLSIRICNNFRKFYNESFNHVKIVKKADFPVSYPISSSQTTIHDCGIFVMKFIELWDGRNALHISQNNVYTYREKISSYMIAHPQNEETTEEMKNIIRKH